jgi:flagellar biogenesis protein FliO
MPTDSASELTTAPGFPLMATGPLWLFLFLALVLGAWWWWARHRGGGWRVRGDQLSIQILATRSLGPRSHLAIIETAGHRSLIATSTQGVQFLRDLPAEAGRGSSDSFARHLAPEGDPSA